jgi:hypothetical protein
MKLIGGNTLVIISLAIAILLYRLSTYKLAESWGRASAALAK